MRYLFVLFLMLGLATVAGAGEQPVQRIVSLGPINTENVFLLGAGDRLVADSDYCVRPEAAKLKPKIGSVLQVNVEKIISLHPDLVLATAMTKQADVRKLESIGIRVVRFTQPHSFAEICSHFLKLGRLLGLETRAQEVVDQVQIAVNEVQAQVAEFPKQTVYLQVGARPLFGSVASSFTHDFIIMSGGINIIANQKTGDTKLEKVIAENPDLIIVAIMGSEMGIAGVEKRKWQRFSILKAVARDRVHIINPDLVCSPSPATFASTLRLIAGLVHPELNDAEFQ
jgi:iron complex transport system substrate-binding protein